MIKKICFLFLVLVILFVDSNINAATYKDKFDENWFYIDNEFVNKTKNGNTKYQQMSMIVRKSDNYFAYCIEPGKSIDETKTLTGYDYDYSIISNLTPQQWERIKLLSFYGYGYEGHLDIKWYVITQFMIWQTNNLGYDIYFTDKLNGNRIEKYTDEMIELDNLVNSHYTLPNFENKQLELFWGESTNLFDKNNVLNKFTVENGPYIETSVSGNNLNVISKNYGSSFIIFKKQEKRFHNKSIVYIDPNNQDLLVPGDLEDVTYRMVINMNHGKVSINKLDYDTKSNQVNHEGSLENAKYGLYNNSNELLEVQYTNKEGMINFNTKLNANKYYIQEMTPSVGYNLDNTKYYFEINKDNYNIVVNVYEKVIKENFEIIKVLDNSETGKMEFESNIEFGIYDLDNSLIKNYVTSEFGIIKFTLPYGKYFLKQHNSYDGYERIKDYEIEVKENNKDNKLVFKDEMIKYKVKINVKEKESLNNLENIKFALYDKENKKICYTIDYPKKTTVCEYKTDKEGNILFPQNLKLDKYYIKLFVDENLKYKYENDVIEFEIKKENNYKKENDYYLIELQYFLTEEKVKYEDNLLDKNNGNSNEIIEVNQEQTLNDALIEIENKDEMLKINIPNIEEGLVVEVPNTLKNNKNNLVCLLIICLIVIKKLL